ncbi:MAG: substrate-binding domain-containing protein, partial [Acetobacteraceae bacterium]
AQGRADWGVAIDTIARQYDLGFRFLQAEQYDFLIPRMRLELPAVQRFIALLGDQDIRNRLEAMGFPTPGEPA